MFTKGSYTFKDKYSAVKLQVFLSMYEILVDTRCWRVNEKLFFHSICSNWYLEEIHLINCLSVLHGSWNGPYICHYAKKSSIFRKKLLSFPWVGNITSESC